MAHGRFDGLQAHAVAQVLGQVLLLVERVQDVGVDAGDQRGHRRGGQGVVHAAAAAADVVPVEGVGEDDVGAGVETRGELVGLMVEVALHLETVGGAHRAQRILAGLGGGAEAVVELQLPAVGQMGDPAGEAQAVDGALARGVVIAAVPRGIVFDELDLRALDADLPGAGAGPDAQDQRAADLVGVHQRPLQRAGAAQGAADDRHDRLDAEFLQRHALDGDGVAHRNRREARTPRAAVRVLRRRAGGAAAPADDVGADDAVLVGVQRPAGADHAVPPARRRMLLVARARGMRVTRQRVLQQDDVRRVGVEAAPPLEGDGDVRDRGAGLRGDVADADVTGLAFGRESDVHRRQDYLV